MPRKNITSKNVGAWLGGNRGYVQSGSNTDTSAKVDSGGGQAEAVRGELGLGAYAAGIGATAAIGAGVAGAVRSGRAAQAVNKLTGQRVIVHGTNNQLKNLKTGKPLEFKASGRPSTRGAVLEPRAGSAGSPDKPVVFGWNPQQRASRARPVIYSSPEMYATKGESAINPQIVVGKVSSRKTRFRDPDLLGNPKGKNVVESSAPVKIKTVVKYNDNYMDNLEKALKRAGAPVPLNYTRIEKIQQRIQNKRNFKKGVL